MTSNSTVERHQINASNIPGAQTNAITNGAAISSSTATQVRHVTKPANLVKKSNILKSNVKASLTAEAS